MSVTSVVNGGGSCGRKPYPKLIKTFDGNIYYVFSKHEGVGIYLNSNKVAQCHFYPLNKSVDWESSAYTDFDGAVTLKND